jgi:hypothetical protein
MHLSSLLLITNPTNDPNYPNRPNYPTNYLGPDFQIIGCAVAIFNYIIDGTSIGENNHGFLSFKVGDLFNVIYNSNDLNGWVFAIDTRLKGGMILDYDIRL